MQGHLLRGPGGFPKFLLRHAPIPRHSRGFVENSFSAAVDWQYAKTVPNQVVFLTHNLSGGPCDRRPLAGAASSWGRSTSWPIWPLGKRIALESTLQFRTCRGSRRLVMTPSPKIDPC
jgi:hypothetical protein